MPKRVFNRSDQKLKRKILRENLTTAETILWNHIKNDKLGYKFVRQYSVESFVIVFYCRKLKLGIEVDGDYHLSQVEYDTERSIVISRYGINIIRFTNDQVTNEIELVLDEINKSFPCEGKVAQQS